MKNSYYSTTAGIRSSDLPHSMTMNKKVPRSYPLGHRFTLTNLICFIIDNIRVVYDDEGHVKTILSSTTGMDETYIPPPHPPNINIHSSTTPYIDDLNWPNSELKTLETPQSGYIFSPKTKISHASPT